MSAAELELVIRRVLGEGLQIHPTVYLLLVVVSLLGGTAGAFVGAYIRKRAENLATKADFDSLLDQLRKQTEETEKIKSEIARAGWIHQRRWDLKRELYSQLLQVLEEIKQKGRWFAQALDRHYASPEARTLVEGFAEHMHQRGTVDKLLAYKALSGMILSDQTAFALDRLSDGYNEMVNVLLQGDNPVDTFLGQWDRGRLFGLLHDTDDVYRLVLRESQTDLLGNDKISSSVVRVGL